MAFVVLAVCALTVLIGAVGLISPASLEVMTDFAPTTAGLYFAAGLRVVLGVALYMVAPKTRAPRTLRVFGVILVVAGLLLPFLGVGFIRGIMDWWLSLGTGIMRAWSVMAIAFGVLLAYAVFPATRKTGSLPG